MTEHTEGQNLKAVWDRAKMLGSPHWAPLTAAQYIWDNRTQYYEAKLAVHKENAAQSHMAAAKLLSEISALKGYVAELEVQLEQRPEITREEDGEIQIEWYKGPGETLSLSIGPGGELSWAYLLPEGSDNDGYLSGRLFTAIEHFLPPTEEPSSAFATSNEAPK